MFMNDFGSVIKENMSRNFETDIVVVGAGPVGLFSVFECGMLGMKCHVVDSLEAIGGQCSALYPEKPIYDIPAFPQVSGAQLIENLELQATPFQPYFHLNQTVESVEDLGGNRWLVKTSSGTQINCSSIVVAAGAGAFGPNRPPMENLEAFEGKSVFYMVKSRDDFVGKKIVIAGGGDSAVDWVLSLSQIADVTLVHRRDKFRAAPESVKQLETLKSQGKIDMIVPAQLKSLVGDSGQLSEVILDDLKGAEIKVSADVLLPFYGLAAKLGPISSWGLNVEGHTITVDQATSQTNVPGIYAVGDVAQYPNKLKLILTGFAEAAQAAHHAWKRLHPDQSLHMEYSTTKGVPGA